MATQKGRYAIRKEHELEGETKSLVIRRKNHGLRFSVLGDDGGEEKEGRDYRWMDYAGSSQQLFKKGNRKSREVPVILEKIIIDKIKPLNCWISLIHTCSGK